MIRYYDNTRLSTFRRCPRMFYLRHVRGWTSPGMPTAPYFGICWHAGQDVLWDMVVNRHIYGADELQYEATKAFITEWVKEFPAEMEYDQIVQFEPYLPVNALEMYKSYIEARMGFMSEVEEVRVEVPFVVPLAENEDRFFYVGRMDKELHYGRFVDGMDHKTTTAYKKDGFFRDYFSDSFSPNTQMDGYLHYLHMAHGQKARQILVDGALVHKTVHHGFTLIPVEKVFALLDEWLAETHHLIEHINQELDAYAEYEDKQGDEPMQFFPKNTDSCFSFGRRCAYYDVCRFQANPSHMDAPPDGMVVQHWKPHEKLGLQELGMEAEDE